MTFLNSILNNSEKFDIPFEHWGYQGALTEEAIEEIVNTDIADVNKHNLLYDGTRAIDGGAAEFREGIASGGKAINFRCFITKENVQNFPNLFGGAFFFFANTGTVIRLQHCTKSARLH